MKIEALCLGISIAVNDVYISLCTLHLLADESSRLACPVLGVSHFYQSPQRRNPIMDVTAALLRKMLPHSCPIHLGDPH